MQNSNSRHLIDSPQKIRLIAGIKYDSMGSMKRLINQRYVVRRNILDIIGLCLCAYFAWHVLGGERSLLRLVTLERQVSRVGAELELARHERESLESRVIKMRPGSIDPDLLEERARAVLGYSRADEHVVVLPN